MQMHGAGASPTLARPSQHPTVIYNRVKVDNSTIVATSDKVHIVWKPTRKHHAHIYIGVTLNSISDIVEIAIERAPLVWDREALQPNIGTQRWGAMVFS